MKFWLPLLLCTAFFSAEAQDILLKNGDRIPKDDVLSKDQFGIMVKASADPENGTPLRRFVPFTEMATVSLSQFPFCDAKSVDRVNTAMLDRMPIIRKKFKDQYPRYQEAKDLSKLLAIHAGVSSYRVLFEATGIFPNGMTGWLYSDSADCSFYGGVFLYGLVGKPDTIWNGEVFPVEGTLEKNGKIYPVFSVIPPVKSTAPQTAENAVSERGSNPPPPPRDGGKNAPKAESRAMRPAGGSPGGHRGGTGSR